jgi:beta-glucosidase
MCAYSSVQGRSGCANDRAMQTILRDTWGHDGFVVSDCGAVGGGPAGAVKAIEAGTDLECNPWGQSLYPSLVNSTLAGNISQAVIARAAMRMLYVRFRLGRWDPPASVPFADKTKYGKDADMSFYEQVSLEAAQQSMVLLKNDGILPLAQPGPYATIAALGLLDCMAAGYDTAGDGNFNKTFVSTALAAAFPASTIKVGMGCGCPLDQPDCEQCPGCNWAPAGLMATCTNYNATNVTLGAAGADLVILHLGFGGRPGENTDLGSEQKDFELYANQTLLIDAALATGKPIILVLFTALPANITGLVANPAIRAIVQAYYPQHHGGTAVVDVLTGKVNPAG